MSSGNDNIKFSNENIGSTFPDISGKAIIERSYLNISNEDKAS